MKVCGETMDNGFIFLHRAILDWDWWDDHNTSRLFIYLLMRANHAPASWQGIDIKRGQVVTSIGKLSESVGLSPMQIRTSINKLKRTSDITSTSTSKNTIISIVNYDNYQGDNKHLNKPVTNEQQTDNKRITTNNNNNNKNNNNNNNTSGVVFSKEFERFWKHYPKQIAKEKSFIAFQNVYDDIIDIETLILKTKKFAHDCRETEIKFIPYPTTWLNERRFNDIEEVAIKSVEKINRETLNDWQTVLYDQYGEFVYRSWFSKAQFKDGQLILPDRFTYNWVNTNYLITLPSNLQNIVLK